jgi:septum site-determining protein MinC
MSTETNPNSPVFQLKASLYTLTTLHLLAPNLDALDAQLNKLRQQAPKFFHSAPIIVDLQRLIDPNALDFKALKDILTQHHLIVVGLRHVAASIRDTAAEAGFAILPDAASSKSSGAHGSSLSKNKKVEQEEETPTAAVIKENTATAKAAAEPVSTSTPTATHTPSMIVTQPVRSGQQIYAQNCDLIVIGAISPGAELIADGNIHVYGSLRGKAIAGAKGNEKARIFCHDLAAELISIAGHYWLSEDIAQNLTQRAPVQIGLKNGHLRLEKI